MNKKELLIIVFLLLISLFSYFLVRINDQGAVVEIKIAQNLYGTYDLSKNQEIRIYDKKGKFLLNCLIKNQKIKVLSSDCPDKICIAEGSIELIGQNIVCLPNQVVIKIIGDAADIDGVLQ